MCKIIAISNQKGGVGKTTTTINLGVSLVNLGKKVLLIDFDPQGNLTMALGFHQPDEIENNIAVLLQNEINSKRELNEYEYKNEYIKSSEGLDFIPANIELAGIENILINTMSRENILKNLLSKYKKDYDYILIDCLPSLNILTVNALTASDEVIIPVQAQYLSAKGVELLLQTISLVKNNLNAGLKIRGVLITMLDNRANFQKEVIQIIKESYGDYIKIFESKIPTSVKVSETQSKGISIFSQKNNKVAESYKNFAKEVISNE